MTLIEDDDVSGRPHILLHPPEILHSITGVMGLNSQTLTEFPVLSLQACTWGVAFEVTGAQVEEALKYLNVREMVRGGYIAKMVDFFADGEHRPPVQALLYIATTDNPLYLGPASPEEIGTRIAISRGKTGHNLEYLLRLAEFMRKSCPHVEDHHLFSVEAAALSVVAHLLAAQ